jgi:hypothetical protein
MSAITSPAIGRQNDHLFFSGTAAAFAATVIVGFTWSFLRTDIAKQLQSTWVKAHMITFLAWILLYVCQNILIARQRVDLHRRLGVAGAILAGLMVALTAGRALAAFLASPQRPAIDYMMLYVVVHVDIILFGTLVAAALLLRRRPETHKRLMFLATIALMDAVVERLPLLGHISSYAPFAILDIFVLCGILHDLVSHGRVNRAYWGGLAIFTFPPGARIAVAVIAPHLIGVGRMT